MKYIFNLLPLYDGGKFNWYASCITSFKRLVFTSLLIFSFTFTISGINVWILFLVSADINTIGAYGANWNSARINFSYSWIVVSLTVSHLLTANIKPFPLSIAYPAICLSCSLMPSSALITTTHISDLSIAFIDLNNEYFSTDSNTLPFFLIPAVSIITNSSLLYFNIESIESRVVPAIFETTTLSSLSIAFINELLPTFGLPINENLILVSSFSSTSLKFIVTASINSIKPVLWILLIGIQVSKPNS